MRLQHLLLEHTITSDGIPCSSGVSAREASLLPKGYSYSTLTYFTGRIMSPVRLPALPKTLPPVDDKLRANMVLYGYLRLCRKTMRMGQMKALQKIHGEK